MKLAVPIEESPELRLDRIVDGIFYTIYGLFGIRLVLALLAVSPEGWFSHLIRVLTDPLYAIFAGILPSLTSDGPYTLALPILLAILLYAVVHGLAKALLRRVARRRAYS